MATTDMYKVALLLLAGLAALNNAFSAPSTTLSVGAEYVEYGTDNNINEIYAPLKLNYRTSSYRIGLAIPYLQVNATFDPLTDSDGTVIDPGGDVSTNGIGDVVLSGTLYDVWTAPKQKLTMDLSGAVKFGTASVEDGLGTGEQDYAVYLDLYHWTYKMTLFTSIGYQLRGDTPEVDLDNSLTFSIGGIHQFNSTFSGGLFYDLRQPSISGAEEPSELTTTLNVRLNNRWSVNAYAFKGLSESSPDWGSGVLLEIRI